MSSILTTISQWLLKKIDFLTASITYLWFECKSFIMSSRKKSKKSSSSKKHNKDNKRNRNKTVKVTATELEHELEYYIMLAEGNEFPEWYDGDKTFMKIPLRQIIGDASAIKNDKNYHEPIRNGLVNLSKNVSTVMFDMKEKYIGQDTIYNFYLSKVVITTQITDADTFVVALIINLKVRDDRKYNMNKYMMQMMPEYEILCPIWQ